MYSILYKKKIRAHSVYAKKSTFNVMEEFFNTNTSYNTVAKG